MVFSCLMKYRGEKALGHLGGVCPVYIMAYSVVFIVIYIYISASL